MSLYYRFKKHLQNEISLKDFLSAMQALAVVAAIIVGSFWTLLDYQEKHKTVLKVNIDRIEIFKMKKNSHFFVSVIARIENNGNRDVYLGKEPTTDEKADPVELFSRQFIDFSGKSIQLSDKRKQDICHVRSVEREKISSGNQVTLSGMCEAKVPGLYLIEVAVHVNPNEGKSFLTFYKAEDYSVWEDKKIIVVNESTVNRFFEVSCSPMKEPSEKEKMGPLHGLRSQPRISVSPPAVSISQTRGTTFERR